MKRIFFRPLYWRRMDQISQTPQCQNLKPANIKREFKRYTRDDKKNNVKQLQQDKCD